jgi:hypothetical protein
MKKADKSMNFVAGGIVNCRTHPTLLYRGKNKHEVTSYGMVYEANEPCDAISDV